ncbi:Monooxygenase [Frankia sp. AiPs1]|uniref:LLM class flavin-dependent oxidoreductase n=1 Tax=Frankia sp. AiPa1 TaxID=573492 RepID=UPI00202AECE1|nr:LLM class flavin-dependent oxidoreductase [Frankia sp. AiPa1]MCL9760307.1 LLM class flavin-dependent oxidoreductase [Frankia sp. AiPa1]
MPVDSAASTTPSPALARGLDARGELSVFLSTPAGEDPGQVYREALAAIQDAETLGYSCAWVAEAHFSSHIGIPTALGLLAAATQVTDRIRLGTAVVPLAFDSPLRLAETAALVNVLSSRRLEFGVGKGNPLGFSTDAYNAFGLHEGDRDQLFSRSLAAVKNALGGPIEAGDKRVALYPPAGDLLDHIWQATGDHATAAAAGAAGDGLLLFRSTPDGAAGDVQSPLIDSYLTSFHARNTGPRIGVSRSVLLGSSRRDAIARATADFEARAAEHPRRPENTDATSVEKYLIDSDIAFGSADDVVETLNHDAAVNRSSTYLFSLPFAATGSPAHREGLEVLATEVHPRLRRRDDALTPRFGG